MLPDSPFMKVAKDRLDEYDNSFTVIHDLNYGSVRRHNTVTESHPDYVLLVEIALDKGFGGAVVDIMPILHAKDPAREFIFPDAKPNKNPDLRINGTLYEVKNATNPNNLNNLKHAIEKASEQADHIIVVIDEPIFLGTLNRVSKSKYLLHKDLKHIEFKTPIGWYSINRETLLFLYR